MPRFARNDEKDDARNDAPMPARTCAEIISADSRQVYRGMDIGTGKDLNEYEDKKYLSYNDFFNVCFYLFGCVGSFFSLG